MSVDLPMARAGSPTKAQPYVPLISTMHELPFLIPLLCNQWLQSTAAVCSPLSHLLLTSSSCVLSVVYLLVIKCWSVAALFSSLPHLLLIHSSLVLSVVYIIVIKCWSAVALSLPPSSCSTSHCLCSTSLYNQWINHASLLNSFLPPAPLVFYVVYLYVNKGYSVLLLHISLLSPCIAHLYATNG